MTVIKISLSPSNNKEALDEPIERWCKIEGKQYRYFTVVLCGLLADGPLANKIIYLPLGNDR